MTRPQFKLNEKVVHGDRIGYIGGHYGGGLWNFVIGNHVDLIEAKSLQRVTPSPSMPTAGQVRALAAVLQQGAEIAQRHNDADEARDLFLLLNLLEDHGGTIDADQASWLRLVGTPAEPDAPSPSGGRSP